MRQDLKHRLITWKNDVHAGEIKRAYISASPLKEGEYVIKLEKTVSETLSGQLNQVVVAKKYLTNAQKDSQKDPASDMYHINRIVDSLEREFADKYDQAINEAFRDEEIHFSEI